MARRKKHSDIAIVLLLVFLAAIFCAVYCYARPLPKLTPHASLKTSATNTAPPKLDWPNGGEGAIGAVGYGTLETTGNQTPRPTASVAKLITALTVLQKYPLDPGQQGPTITLTTSDVALYNHYLAEDGSVAKVTDGEKITEYQALQAMMLPSANNMADSLAVWAYGSLNDYQAAATDFVKSLGMNHTTIGSDASGFSPDTTSTASDLVTLGLAVLQNQALAIIVGQPSATIPVAGTVYNVNGMLGVDGIVGIKTGNNDQDPGVYLFAAKANIDQTHSVIIVGAVEGQSDLKSALAAAPPLIDSTRSHFAVQKLVTAGQTIGTYSVPWGSTVAAIAPSTITNVVWNGQIGAQTANLHNLKAPVAANSAVGSLVITSNSGTNASPVVLQRRVPAPSIFWRIFRHNL